MKLQNKNGKMTADEIYGKFNAYNHQMAQVLLTFLAYHQIKPNVNDFVNLLGIRDKKKGEKNLLSAFRECYIFLMKKGYIAMESHKRVKEYCKSPLDRIPCELFEVKRNQNDNKFSLRDKNKGKSVIGFKRKFTQLNYDKVNNESTDFGDENDDMLEDDDDDDSEEPPRKKARREMESLRNDVLDAIAKNSKKIDQISKGNNNNDAALFSPSKKSAMESSIDRGIGKFSNEYIVHSENKMFKLIHQRCVADLMNDGNDRLIEDLLNDTNKGAVATVQGK